MIIGIWYGIKLLKLINKKTLKIQLTITLILTCFFLIGYTTYLYNLIKGNLFSFTPILISSIFCFGAGFVVLILNILYETNLKNYQGAKK